MKTPKPYKNVIQHELYNYDETKAVIEEVKDQIINKPPAGVGEQDRVRGGPVSDPTARDGLTLVTNTALEHMERTVKAIETALERLGWEHKTIFELEYRQKCSWKWVVGELYVSEATYFRKKAELIDMVAMQLGYILPADMKAG